MSRPRIYDTEAIVLRTSPLGEADRLFTLLTPHLGKLRVTARGVRKPTSKLGGHLDSLTRSSLTLARGRNLDTITGADTRETFPLLKGNLDRLSRAIYLTELVDAISPLEAPNPAEYTLFLDGLRILETDADPELVVRYMELQLLSISGFLPELRHCVECHGQVTPDQHLVSPAAGGVVCPSCRSTHSDAMRISLNALKLLRFLSTATMPAAVSLRVKPPLHREVAAVMDAFLRRTLERELRSAAFVRSVTRPISQVDIPAPASGT